MKSFRILFGILLLFCGGRVLSENLYYWCNNERIPLEKSSNEIVIKTKEINLEKIKNIEGFYDSKYRIKIIKTNELSIIKTQLSQDEYEIYPVYYSNGYKMIALKDIYIKFTNDKNNDKIITRVKNKYKLEITGLNENGIYRYRILEGDTLNIANTIYEKENVEIASPVFLVEIKSCSIPNDPYYNNLSLPVKKRQTWYMDMINLQKAWDICEWVNDVIVAVVDSGVALNHDEFQGILVPGYDFRENDDSPQPWDDSNGKVGPTPPPPYINPHGTYCAGIIGAITNNGKGIAGIAGKWDSKEHSVKIMPIRIGENDFIEDWEIANAYQWAVDNGTRILNNSYTAPKTDVLTSMIDYCTNRGALFIFAAGNGEGEISGIATYDKCFVVGASTQDDKRAKSSLPKDTSCYGRDLDVMTPVYYFDDPSIITCNVTNLASTDEYYLTFGGTSAATSLAAGIAALLKIHYGYSAKTIKNLLSRTADDLTEGDASLGWDKYTGYGRVNAFGALLGFARSHRTSYVNCPDGEYTVFNSASESCGKMTVSTSHKDENGIYWGDGRAELNLETKGRINYLPLSYGIYLLSSTKNNKTYKMKLDIDYSAPLIHSVFRKEEENKISYLVIDKIGDQNNSTYNSVWFLDANDNILVNPRRMHCEGNAIQTIDIPSEVLAYGVNNARIMLIAIDPAGNDTVYKSKITDLPIRTEYSYINSCSEEGAIDQIISGNVLEMISDITFPYIYSDTPVITELKSNGINGTFPEYDLGYAEIVPGSYRMADGGYAGASIRTNVYWITEEMMLPSYHWRPGIPERTWFEYKISGSILGAQFNPFPYEYGGNGKEEIKELSFGKKSIVKYIYPSDPDFKIYNWIKLRTGTSRNWTDAGTYIDYANNRLVVKIYLNGSLFNPARFSYTFYALGRKEMSPPPGRFAQISSFTVQPGLKDHLCDEYGNLEVFYDYTGSERSYKTTVGIYDISGALVENIVEDRMENQGPHTLLYGFYTLNTAYDTDGDGKLDPGKYKVRLNINSLQGTPLVADERNLVIKSGEYFLPGDRTVDTGIRVDIGGTYSKGSIDQVDSPFILKLRNGTYRLYYEAGTDGSGYQGWYRRIMTGYSSDGKNWTLEGEVTGLDTDILIEYPDHRYPSAVELPDGSIRLYYSVWGIMTPQAGEINGWIVSAVSEDGVNFTRESGKRIDFGGAYDADRADGGKIYFDAAYGLYFIVYTGLNYDPPTVDGSAHINILWAASEDGYYFNKIETPLIGQGCYFDNWAVYQPAYHKGELYYTGRRQTGALFSGEYLFKALEAGDIFEKDREVKLKDTAGTEPFIGGLYGYAPYLLEISGRDILYFAGYDGEHKRIYSGGFDETVLAAITEKRTEGTQKNAVIPGDPGTDALTAEGGDFITGVLPAGSTFQYVYPDIDIYVNGDIGADEAESALTGVRTAEHKTAYTGTIRIRSEGRAGNGYARIEKMILEMDGIKLSETAGDVLEYILDTGVYPDGEHRIRGIGTDGNGFSGIKETVCSFGTADAEPGTGTGSGTDYSYILDISPDDGSTDNDTDNGNGGEDGEEDTAPRIPDVLYGFNKPGSAEAGYFEGAFSILVADRNAGDQSGNDAVKVFDVSGNLRMTLGSIDKPERICLSPEGGLYALRNDGNGILRYDGEKGIFVPFIGIKNPEEMKWNKRNDTLCVLKGNTVSEYGKEGKKTGETVFSGMLNSFAIDEGSGMIAGNIAGTGVFEDGGGNDIFLSAGSAYSKEMSDFVISGSMITGIDISGSVILTVRIPEAPGAGAEESAYDNIMNGACDISAFRYGYETVFAVTDRNADRVVFLTSNGSAPDGGEYRDDDTEASPEEGEKIKAYPNPAKDSIVFAELPEGGEIRIYDLSGNAVKTIAIEGYTAVWELRNTAGLDISSGVYFYTVLKDGKPLKTGKIAVLK